MATKLDPNILAQLQALGIGSSGMQVGDMWYQPTWSYGMGENMGTPELSGYAAYNRPSDPNASMPVGAPIQNYTADGEFSHESKVKELNDTWMKLAILGITGGAATGLFGGTLGTSTLPGAAGAGGSGAGAIGGWEMGLQPSGAVVGGPMSTGLPVGTALPSMGSMAGIGTAAAGAGAGGAGGAGGAAGGAAAAGSSLIPGISNSSLLGAGMTALGGLSGTGGGGGGGENTEMVNRYLSGEGGLYPQVQSLLARQGPISEANAMQLRNAGQSLLSRPVAGNPFLR